LIQELAHQDRIKYSRRV